MTYINRCFDAVLVTLAVVAGVILSALALVVPVDVMLRFFFTHSITGLTDVIESTLMASVFLAAPWVLRNNGHVAVEIFVQSTPARVQSAMRAAACLIGAALSFVVTSYAIIAVIAAFQRGTMVRKSIIFPEWWTIVPVVICFALMALEFSRQIFAPQSVASVRSH